MKIRLAEETKRFIETKAEGASMSAADIYRLCFEVGVGIVKKEGIAGLVRAVEELRGEDPPQRPLVAPKSTEAFAAESPAHYVTRRRSAS